MPSWEVRDCPGLYRQGFSASGAWGQGHFQAEEQGQKEIPAWARADAHACRYTRSRFCAHIPASLSAPGTAQRLSLLLNSSMPPPCPRGLELACHVCGRVSVNRQCWAGDEVCYSNSAFYFLKDTPCNLPLFPLPPFLFLFFSSPLPLPLNGPITPISLWGEKEGRPRKS